MKAYLIAAVFVGCVLVSASGDGILAVSTRNRGSPPTFSCEGREKGYYPDLYRNCHVYYSCDEEGSKHQYQCESGKSFDQHVWACMPEDLVTCPIPGEVAKRFRGGPPVLSCEGRDDGFYADHYRNCQVYYSCNDGVKEDHHCESGEQFDEKIRACLHEDFVECSIEPVEKRFIGGPPVFSCDGRDDGFYADHYRNCQIYYMCKDGVKEDRHCKSGERFDEKIWACLEAEHVECTIEPVQKRALSGPCEGKPDGYIANRDQMCRSYHKCAAGQSEAGTCEDGTLFDESVNACVKSFGTTCPTSSKRALQESVEGLKKVDDRLVQQLERLLRKIQKNRR